MVALNRNYVILVADDDEDDRKLLKDTFDDLLDVRFDARFFADGTELMDYLLGRNEYEHSNCSPRPDLILLDLNMPRKNGFRVLKEIRSNDNLLLIPVIVFSTSRNKMDIQRACELGASAFIRKPASLDQLEQIVSMIREFWDYKHSG